MRMIYSLAAATTLAFATLLPQVASAERACREECSNGVCRQECVETERRGERREERSEERREDRREDRREERREERPGVELRLPGVGIEVGR